MPRVFGCAKKHVTPLLIDSPPPSHPNSQAGACESWGSPQFYICRYSHDVRSGTTPPLFSPYVSPSLPHTGKMIFPLVALIHLWRSSNYAASSFCGATFLFTNVSRHTASRAVAPAQSDGEANAPSRSRASAGWSASRSSSTSRLCPTDPNRVTTAFLFPDALGRVPFGPWRNSHRHLALRPSDSLSAAFLFQSRLSRPRLFTASPHLLPSSNDPCRIPSSTDVPIPSLHAFGAARARGTHCQALSPPSHPAACAAATPPPPHGLYRHLAPTRGRCVVGYGSGSGRNGDGGGDARLHPGATVGGPARQRQEYLCVSPCGGRWVGAGQPGRRGWQSPGGGAPV